MATPDTDAFEVSLETLPLADLRKEAIKELDAMCETLIKAANELRVMERQPRGSAVSALPLNSSGEDVAETANAKVWPHRSAKPWPVSVSGSNAATDGRIASRSRNRGKPSAAADANRAHLFLQFTSGAHGSPFLCARTAKR